MNKKSKSKKLQQKYGLLILSVILIGSSISFLPSYAAVSGNIVSGYKPVISIIDPPANIPLVTNTTTVSGTYRLVNFTDTPYVNISIDNGAWTAATVSNGGFGLGVTLSGGAHEITAQIIENGVTSTDSETVSVFSGQATIAKVNAILVYPSKTCETLMKIGDYSKCPSLGTLKQYDTSNQNYAGKIIKLPNGTWERTKPETTNWYNFVNSTGPATICIDCEFPLATTDYAQEVFLDPSNFAYANTFSSEFQNTTEDYWNGTMELTRTVTDPIPLSSLSISSQAYIEADCMTGHLVYSPKLMSNLLAYMISGCTNARLNPMTNSTINIPNIPFDFKDSNWYHGYIWTQKALDTSVNNCITQKCNIPPDPYHSTDKKFGW